MERGSLEERIAKAEPVLRSATTKWVLATAAAALVVVQSWLGDSLCTRILLPAFVAALYALLWTLSLLCIRKAEIARLETELSKLRDDKKEVILSQEAFSILCMIYDKPDEIEDAHIQEKLSLVGSDFDLAFDELLCDDPYIVIPDGDTLDSPRGYGITPKGRRYVKAERA